MKLKLDRVSPGDEITTEHFNRLHEALRALQINLAPGANLDVQSTPAGYTVAANPRKGLWIKLTGNSSNAYSWTEQLPQPSGTWADGYRSGTTSADPAHEINGNTSPPSLPLIVWAWRAPQSGEVVFQVGGCA